MTVKELIEELQSLSDYQQNQPVFIYLMEETDNVINQGERTLSINSIDDTMNDRVDLNITSVEYSTTKL